MKTGFQVLVFLTLLLTSAQVQAKKDSGLHAYFAFGGNLTPGDSVRLGWNRWEFGKLHPAMYGASKILPINATYYTSLGFGLMGSGFGLMASAGFNTDLFWGIGLRGELFASTNSQGFHFSHGLIGFSWNY